MNHSQNMALGYKPGKLLDAICQKVLTGEVSSPQFLFDMQFPHELSKCLDRAIRSSEKWQQSRGINWNIYGVGIEAIASWGNIVAVQMNRYTYRFQILHLDRAGRRMVFSIPVQSLESLSRLPNIDYSNDEMRALIEMANDLGGIFKTRELFVRIKHPGKDVLLAQCAKWPIKKLDEQAFLDLLNRIPTLLPIVTATLDAQLRSFKPFSQAPSGIYYFHAPKGASNQWFCKAVAAMAFVNNPGKIGDGAIEITLKDAGDLKRWKACYGRVAIIRVSTTSSLWPLIKAAEDVDRIQKSGGCPPNPFPTVPIALGNGVLQCPQAVDVALSEVPVNLSDFDQDLIRTAMVTLLKKDVAREINMLWKRYIIAPTIYRANRFYLWQNLLCRLAIECWFTSAKLSACAKSLYQQRQVEQEQIQARRQEAMQRAMCLLANPSKYDSQIIERPPSKEAAIQALSENAVAFWYKPQKGANRGQVLLAFNEFSLKRLLRQAECDDILYEPFLTLCEKEGLLDQRNRSITLGGETFNAITFYPFQR